MSWGARFNDYFGLTLALEIAGRIGFIYPFCHLVDEDCRLVKYQLAELFDFGWVFAVKSR